jgi:hypothetical protein
MTDGVAYLAAIVLALVFTYSAVAKLRDAHPTRRAIRAAGLPGGGVVAKVLPALELITAVLLVVLPAVGAYFGLILLGVFTAFIGLLLVRKIDVSCGCFGADAGRSASHVDMMRNVFLLLIAGVATSVRAPAQVALEEVIAVTTAAAIGAVVLVTAGTRRELGQLFDNRLPGER